MTAPTDREIGQQLLDELATEADGLAAWDFLQDAAELLGWELTLPGNRLEPDETLRYIVLSAPSVTMVVVEKRGPDHTTLGPFGESGE